MIEGLKIHVSGAELRSLCQKQAQHHQERADFYESQLSTLKTLDNANTSSRPGEAAERKIQEHQFRAQEMQFIAEHVVINETYQLGEGDLYKLGIGNRGY